MFSRSLASPWSRAPRLFVAAALMLALLPLSAQAKVKPPKKAEAHKIAHATMLKFNEALNAKDFGEFHKFIAKFWKKQITPEQLLAAFKVYIDQEINLDLLKNLEPALDVRPKVDGDDTLWLVGNYSTRPNQVYFFHKYIKEGGKWKLIYIQVNVSPVNEMVPYEPVAAKIARRTLLKFNKAVKAGDFTEFYKFISKLWQQQITPEQFKQAFQAFIDQKIDIGGVAKADPVLAPDPYIDEEGVLHLDGVFQLKKKVKFNLGYVMEADEWKLISINVNVI